MWAGDGGGGPGVPGGGPGRLLRARYYLPSVRCDRSGSERWGRGGLAVAASSGRTAARVRFPAPLQVIARERARYILAARLAVAGRDAARSPLCPRPVPLG